jgi:hypothetical protein
MPLTRLHSTSLGRKEQSQERMPQQLNQGESPIGYGVRTGARTLTNVGSRIAGLPGDLISAGVGVGRWLTGGEEGPIPSYSQIQNKLPVSVPTSENIRESANKLTGGYTQPQSKSEQFFDDVIGDIASVFIPARAKVPLQSALSTLLSEGNAAKIASAALPFVGKKSSLQTATKLALGGNVAAKGAEVLGANPLIQSGARLMGSVLAAVPGTRTRLEKQIPSLYAGAEAEISHPQFILPSNTAEANPILKSLYSAKEKLSREARPNQEIAEKGLNKIIEALENSAVDSGLKTSAKEAQKVIPMKELVKLKQTANQWIELTSRPRFEGEKYLPKNLRDVFEDVSRKLIDPINEYAKTNPKFAYKWNMAEDLFKGFNALEPATRFLKENITLKDSLGSNVAKSGIFGGITYGLGLPAALGSLAGAKVTKDVLLLKDLVRNSATAKQAYWDIINFAAHRNKPMVIKNLAKFDKEAIKYEKKNKSKLRRVIRTAQ